METEILLVEKLIRDFDLESWLVFLDWLSEQDSERAEILATTAKILSGLWIIAEPASEWPKLYRQQKHFCETQSALYLQMYRSYWAIYILHRASDLEDARQQIRYYIPTLRNSKKEDLVRNLLTYILS